MGRIHDAVQRRAIVPDVPSHLPTTTRIGEVLRQRRTASAQLPETIGPPRPLSAKEFFPLTTQLRSPLTVVAPALDVLGMPFRLADVGIEQLRRASEGRPVLPFREALATELRGGEQRLENGQPARLEPAMKAGLETVAAQPIFGVIRPLSRMGLALRNRRAIRRVEEPVQARRPIDVETAERRRRSGRSPPGFVRRAARLPSAQRQELTRRLGLTQRPEASQRASIPQLPLLKQPTPLPPSPAPVFIPVSPTAVKAPESLTARPPGIPEPRETHPPVPSAKIFRPIVRLRARAIRAVQEDLMEQARLLSKGTRRLQAEVMQAGGIKPPLGGGVREELRAIRPFLRANGRAIDELATELGFDDGEALRQALIAVQGQQWPTRARWQQEATAIVDSEPGERLLQALQAKGSTRQAIHRTIRDVTQGMSQLLREARQATARIVRRGISETQQEAVQRGRVLRRLEDVRRRTALTPFQLARVARRQRLTPGAVTQGPRGGATEAPLTPEELTQVQARAARIVPRFLTPIQRAKLTAREPVALPGGPNQPPPILPRQQALVPHYAPGRFRELTPLQSFQASGLPPRQAMAMIDRGMNGPTFQRWDALRRAEIEAFRTHRVRYQELLRLSGNIPNRSVLGKEITNLLEETGGPSTPKGRQIAAWLRQAFEEDFEAVNRTLISLRLKPIVRRSGYMTHLTSPEPWQALRAAAMGKTVEQVSTLGDAVPQALRPGFRFGRPRIGGPAAIDPLTAFRVYDLAAQKVIGLSASARALETHAEQLPPLARQYVRRVILQTVSAFPGEVGQSLQPVAGRLQALTTRFARGTVLGNLSSVIMQSATTPALLSSLRHSTSAPTALWWISHGRGGSFAEQWSTVLQGRLVEGLDPGLLTGYRSLTDKLGGAMTGVDRFMVAFQFDAAYLDALRSGMAHPEAVRYADDVAGKTQSEFLRSTLAPVFADELLRNFVVFQNTVNANFNYLKVNVLAPGRPETGRMIADLGSVFRTARVWRQAAVFLGSAIAMGAWYRTLGLPFPDRVTDWIPGLGNFRGGPPPQRLASDAYAMLTSPLLHERRRAKKNFVKGLAITILGPPMNQIFKTLEGLSVISTGGLRNRIGQLQFPVEGFDEQTRAFLFGPYGTKAGQAYIRRGFTTAPKATPRRIIELR